MSDEIEKLQAQRERIDAEIQAARARGLQGFLTTLRALIDESPYPLEEVLAGLRSRKAPTRKTSVFCLKADPSKRYIKGPTPAWLEDAMTAVNMDPRARKDREMFKAIHMVCEGIEKA